MPNNNSWQENIATIATNTAGAGANVNGQATMANSAPVVIASNQSTLPAYLIDSGGTNKVGVDASGNLQVRPGNVENSTPWQIEQNISYWIRNGQAYNGTTGAVSVGGAINSVAFSVFNGTGSGKSIYIYSFRVLCNLTAFALFTLITTDLALTGQTVSNMKIGGSASAASCTGSSAAQTPAGTAFDRHLVSASWPGIELFDGRSGLLLPAGAANGLAVFMNLSATCNYTVTTRWIEY